MMFLSPCPSSLASLNSQAKHCTNICTFNPHNKSARWVLSLSPFCRWQELGHREIKQVAQGHEGHWVDRGHQFLFFSPGEPSAAPSGNTVWRWAILWDFPQLGSAWLVHFRIWACQSSSAQFTRRQRVWWIAMPPGPPFKVELLPVFSLPLFLPPLLADFSVLFPPPFILRFYSSAKFSLNRHPPITIIHSSECPPIPPTPHRPVLITMASKRLFVWSLRQCHFSCDRAMGRALTLPRFDHLRIPSP